MATVQIPQPQPQLHRIKTMIVVPLHQQPQQIPAIWLRQAPLAAQPLRHHPTKMVVAAHQQRPPRIAINSR